METQTNFSKEWLKCNNCFLIMNYISKISSFSNVFSNFFNSSLILHQLQLVPLNWKKSLEPIIRSLGQFFFTKRNYFNFKRFYLQSPKISLYSCQEINLWVSICEPIMPKILQANNPVVRNIDSCFSHYWTTHLISFAFTWKLQKIISSLLTYSFAGSFVFVSSQKCPKWNLHQRLGQ